MAPRLNIAVARAARARGCGLAMAMAMAIVLAAALPATGAEPQVIVLTQTGCQFLESENGVDHEFKTSKKADCDAINAKTGSERLSAANALTLAPGDYIFRVTNRDVPYELGFWLRDTDYDYRNPLHKLTKTSISGGGLLVGRTQDYKVKLVAGEYLYSCPLNTTPDYRLIVRNQ